MPFVPPSWVPELPFDPPDSVPICDFMLDDRFGRHPLGYSHNPFTCGLTGKTYTSLDVKERVDWLARGLSKELGFQPNSGSEWDKVIAVFSVNTVSAAHVEKSCDTDIQTARYATACMGNASPRWHSVTCKCRLQHRRARVSIEELGCEGSLHLRTPT
jgi:hypothetical protein